MHTNTRVYNEVADKSVDKDSFADLTGFNERKSKRRDRRMRKGHSYD